MSTVPVALARELGAAALARGVAFARRARRADGAGGAEGTLSIMVGAEPALFERLRPYLACMGTEITHCGAVGAGAAVKLMNNMVVAQTVVALAEALAVARASGAVDPEVLFRTLAKGSADSFVLRNHGMKSLLPDDHPDARRLPHQLHHQGSLLRHRPRRGGGARPRPGRHDQAPHGANRGGGLSRQLLHRGDPHHAEEVRRARHIVPTCRS